MAAVNCGAGGEALSSGARGPGSSRRPRNETWEGPLGPGWE